jgi:hypothetical protein
LHPVVVDPIVRPAREAPVSDRGIERDRLAVKNEFGIAGAVERKTGLSGYGR